MLGNLAFDAVVAALLLAGWYLWFRRVNHHRAVQILRWIDCAFSGHASIARLRWQSASRFDVELQLCPSVFRRVTLAIQLEPREMPVNWLIGRIRKRKETLTFRAELDCPAAFNLNVQNHRWCGRTRRILPASLGTWHFESLTPMVISTRNDWQKDVGSMLETLLTTRSRDLLHLEFRKRAPHFIARAPLHSLHPDAPGSGLFEVLRELASSASHSAHRRQICATRRLLLFSPR